jgi:mRNA interferase RelE/StbE
MKVTFKTSFFRDVKKTPAVLHPDIDRAINEIETARSIKEISGLKKLKGHHTAYRIKINTYRLCLFYENETVIVARFLPRKDVYRFFP